MFVGRGRCYRCRRRPRPTWKVDRSRPRFTTRLTYSSLPELEVKLPGKFNSNLTFAASVLVSGREQLLL